MKRTHAKPQEAPRAFDVPGLLTITAIVLALVLVCVRMTVSIAVRPMMGINSGPGLDPGPTTILALDMLCWVPALLVLVRRAIDPQYTLRVHWSHLPMALLAIWVWVSCNWASDKFNALINASTWTAAMLVGWAMCQLVRSWARFRLVAGVGAGLLLILIAQAAIYRWVEWPQMKENWSKEKTEILASIGATPDSYTARQLEQKILSGELIGTFRSPNAFAAATALCALVTVGAALQRLNDRDEPGFAAAIGLPSLASFGILWLTGSRTALAGLILCAGIGVIAWWKRDLLSRRAKGLFFAGCGVVVLTVIAVIAIGLVTGGLVQDSLTFRWNYWVGSWSLFKAHPLVGVGWDDFAHAYLAHRLPIAAEEIADPHNVIVTFLTETGVIGAILAIAWLTRSSWEITRPLAPRGTAAVSSLAPVAFVAVGFCLIHFIVQFPLSFELTAMLKLLLYGVLLAFAMILCTVESATKLTVDSRPAPLILLGCITALGGFLLHAMVDFAFFETGPLLMMCAVLGAVLGIRHPGAAGKKPQTVVAIIAMSLLFIGWISLAALLVLPVASAEASALKAYQARSAASAATFLREAYVNAPVSNFEYPARAADALRTVPATPPADVLDLLTKAINADPRNPAQWVARADYYRTIPDPSHFAMGDYAKAVELNPNSAPLRIDYANYLLSIGEKADAVTQYRIALEFNDKLHRDEPRRLPPAEVARIKQIVEQP